MRTRLPAPLIATSLLDPSARRSCTTAQHRRDELKIQSSPVDVGGGRAGRQTWRGFVVMLDAPL